MSWIFLWIHFILPPFRLKSVLIWNIWAYLKDMVLKIFSRNSHCVSWLSAEPWFEIILSDEKYRRAEWDPLHPTLISEALFAIANIFSFMRLSKFASEFIPISPKIHSKTESLTFFLVYLFNSNVHMGPLQISLGRMLFDISKFLFIYFLVLFAFANGLNQLYYNYGNNGTVTTNSPHAIIPRQASN